MNLEILLSCMQQTNTDIIECSHIYSDILIINQCNQNGYIENNNKGYSERMISTTERGLSSSRNMAIKNAKGDICLICDDDEIFEDRYYENILTAFKELPHADIIVFKVKYKNKKYPSKIQKINYLSALKVSSVQIAFRRKSILKKDICFDETVGSGVSKAGGEEIVFLFECLKKKLRIYFYPIFIAEVKEGKSQWFSKFDHNYFFDRGVFTKKLQGKSFAFIYGLYFLIFKYTLYKKDISPIEAFVSMSKGIWFNKNKL